MKLRIICLLAVLGLFAGCATTETELANPASKYCIEQGGTLDIVDTEDGSVGMCKLPEGTVCEEWAYYNGECPAEANITDFESCVAAGNPVMESYPRQCRANGETFVEDIPQNITIEEKCENLGGEWLGQFSECEGISQEDCEQMGGNFDNCASACRNDPNATVCTMQCVMVCSFQEEETPQQACENDGGKWLPQHEECEFMSEDRCIETGGEFYSCESACRNDPDAEMCTKQCVPVCKY